MPGKASLSGEIDYCLVGTNFHTFPAGGAFVIINYCKIILHVDSIVWTYFFALFTGNTRILTNLLRNSAFIERLASYMHHFGFWQYTDDLPGTNGCTFSTARATFLDHLGKPILPHIHCLKFTGFYACTETQATVVTAKKTASDNVCCATVFNPIISKFIFHASCMAHYNRHHTFSIFEFDSHNVCYELCHSSLSYRTTTDGRFSFHYCQRESATARLTTCATICARQYFINTINARINPNRKFIRGNGQSYPKDHT